MKLRWVVRELEFPVYEGGNGDLNEATGRAFSVAYFVSVNWGPKIEH